MDPKKRAEKSAWGGLKRIIAEIERFEKITPQSPEGSRFYKPRKSAEEPLNDIIIDNRPAQTHISVNYTDKQGIQYFISMYKCKPQEDKKG